MTPVPVSEHEPRIAAANLRLPASGTVFTVAVLALTAMIAATSTVLARPVPTSFADLAEQVAPAVVTITTTQKSGTPMVGFEGDRRRLPFAPDSPFPEFFDRFFDRDDLDDGTPMMPKAPEQGARALGSGFIMNPEGYVITNNHVIAKAQDIEVTLKGGESFEAELVGRDEKTDLALLEYLLRHAGQVVTRTMLLEQVWDYHFDPQTNVIDVHVSRLRQKIDRGFDRPLLQTVRGAGYSLRATDQP